MTPRIGLLAAALAFVVLATANSGGYRYGISDQAFYVPALARSLDPALFPRDSAILAPQMRLWLGDNIIGALGQVVSIDLPTLFAALYLVSLAGLFAAVVGLARSLGTSAWGVAATLALFTLRHRIAKTGANTLEGYGHPRMLAFAAGLAALACVLRRRHAAAVGLVALAAVIHPTTALWFGAALGAAVLSEYRRARWVGLVGAGAAVALVARGPLMDSAWLAVLADKDYLFPLAWPAYAWILNLAYPLVLYLLYRRRVAAGVAAPGESALVVGLLLLVAGFLVSVPLGALSVATVVQLQVNRVFWVLDAVVAAYVAWWLIDDLGARRSARLRAALAALLIAVSAARGSYVLAVEARRPLFQWTLAPGEWRTTMTWLRALPADTYVLADPGHAWKYGTSVRVAALKDTLVETGKDTAMAMYDRPAAMAIAQRLERLRDFDTMTAEGFRAIRTSFGVDVLVLERTRSLALPVLFENGRFSVYDLR